MCGFSEFAVICRVVSLEGGIILLYLYNISYVSPNESNRIESNVHVVHVKRDLVTTCITPQLMTSQPASQPVNRVNKIKWILCQLFIDVHKNLVAPLSITTTHI